MWSNYHTNEAIRKAPPTIGWGFFVVFCCFSIILRQKWHYEKLERLQNEFGRILSGRHT